MLVWYYLYTSTNCKYYNKYYKNNDDPFMMYKVCKSVSVFCEKNISSCLLNLCTWQCILCMCNCLVLLIKKLIKFKLYMVNLIFTHLFTSCTSRHWHRKLCKYKSLLSQFPFRRWIWLVPSMTTFFIASVLQSPSTPILDLKLGGIWELHICYCPWK